MKITLARRRHGVHRDVAETEITGDFADYATPKPGGADDFTIDEDRLLAALPDGFLPCPPGRVLLTVEDEISGTGQRGLTLFQDWAKYFDAYVINLVMPTGAGERTE